MLSGIGSAIWNRQNSQEPEAIRSSLTRHRSALWVFGKTAHLQIKYGKFQGSSDPLNCFRVELGNRPRHLTIKLNAVSHGNRCDACVGNAVEQPVAHAAPPARMAAGNSLIGHGR